MMNSTSLYLSAGVAAAVLSCSAVAQGVKTKSHNDWVTVSGAVGTIVDDSFNLMCGENNDKKVLVELDDWDNFAEAQLLTKGEKVTVTGKIDDDLFERRSIEANSVYSKDDRTYYYGNAADEEDDFYPYGTGFYYGYAPLNLDVNDYVALTGRVQSITGREFVLDTGTRQITVDTLGMSYNPLDNTGYQRIDIGDRVSVSGEVGADLFDMREIDASTIVTLSSS